MSDSISPRIAKSPNRRGCSVSIPGRIAILATLSTIGITAAWAFGTPMATPERNKNTSGKESTSRPPKAIKGNNPNSGANSGTKPVPVIPLDSQGTETVTFTYLKRDSLFLPDQAMLAQFINVVFSQHRTIRFGGVVGPPAMINLRDVQLVSLKYAGDSLEMTLSWKFRSHIPVPPGQAFDCHKILDDKIQSILDTRLSQLETQWADEHGGFELRVTNCSFQNGQLKIDYTITGGPKPPSQRPSPIDGGMEEPIGDNTDLEVRTSKYYQRIETLYAGEFSGAWKPLIARSGPAYFRARLKVIQGLDHNERVLRSAEFWVYVPASSGAIKGE